MLDLTDDYRELFLSQRPLLDVRAPIEFAKGAFPGAVNIPLIDDTERHQVGLQYAEQGNTAALELGHRLVSGPVKQQRIDSWQSFAERHPDGALYCFRGGQRSQIAQQWLAEAGIDYPRVAGGYKAMRQFLLATTERLATTAKIVLIGGRTGVGKTDLLLQLDDQADLEGFANHRGSGFGRRPSGQPVQINFENALAMRLLQIDAADHRRLVFEDESRAIGRCHIPLPLWNAFQTAPLVLLEDSLANRVARIRRDYIDGLYRDYCELEVSEPFEQYSEALLASLQRISRRLGGARYQQLDAMMRDALVEQANSGNVSTHDHWIEPLLTEYYDPMYDYQLQHKAGQIVAQGNPEALLRWLATEA